MVDDRLHLLSLRKPLSPLPCASSFSNPAQPDVVTLDVLIPPLDGWSTLAAFKENSKLADTPVIMLSIVGEKGAGYALGASEYLSKPVELPLTRNRPTIPL